jgi:hypothetical protein
MRIMFFILVFCYATALFGQSSPNENKYRMIFFYKEQNEKTHNLQQVFDQAMLKMGSAAEFIKINIKDPANQALVDKYNLKRSAMPFVLIIAPNGAITGGFPSFTEEQLQNAIVSQGTAKILKALQDRKLVVLALQNKKTANNAAAMQGVNDFKADPRFGSAVEIVVIDPSDVSEHKFLNTLSLDPNITQAQTVLIAPPAEILGKYQGQTTKKQFVDCVQNAASGCCPGGCCPGGCCPGGCCCPGGKCGK